MTTMDLIHALSAAEDAQLLHSEQQTPRRVQHGPRKALRRTLLVAAALALLVGGAFALHALRSIPVSSTVEQSAIAKIYVTDGAASDVRYSYADVRLELTPNPDAPQQITHFYAPELPASRWTQLPLTLSVGQELDPAVQGVLLRWERDDGVRLSYRQQPMRAYVAELPFNTVCTGFNADCRTEACTLGAIRAQRLLVAPSQAEVDGVLQTCDGQQNLYWSDGDYIYSLETGISISDAELTAILESIREVEDIKACMLIEYVEPEESDVPWLEAETVLFPAEVPAGYTLTVGSEQPNGGYLFIWQQAEPTDLLALTIEPAGTVQELTRYYDTVLPRNEHETHTVGAYTVECYREDTGRIRLFWSDGTADYMLDAGGAQVPTLDELLALVAAMRQANPAEYLR